MERRHTNRPAKVEQRADGKEYITGYGIVFYREGDPSTEYELWEGAVERVHPNFADRAMSEKQDIRGLFNHDANRVLGRTLSGTMTLTKDATGIRYDILYNDNDDDHRNTREKTSRGDVSGSSFAFNANKVQWEKREDGVEVRWLMDGDIYDVGPVTYPAYGGTTAVMRAVSDVSDIRSERDKWATMRDNASRRRQQVEAFLMETE